MRAPRLDSLPPSLTSAALWELLGRLERERLELKSSANHLTAEIAAMAMTEGGLIVIGIDDKRTVIGCPLDQKTLDRVMRAGHACGVDVQPREIAVDGEPVTVVAVPEVRGRIVTTPDGRLVRRVGSDNQPLVGDALARFVREREERIAEDEPVAAVAEPEWDIALINEALAADGRRGISRRSVMRGLLDLGVADLNAPPLGPTVTKAAVLLFAAEPRKYVAGASVQIVRRLGVGPGAGVIEAREELAGPLPRLLGNVLTFLERHTGRREAVIGTHRERLPEYPVEVLREAVLNALAHRDYHVSGATTDITVWDDRIEIRSPGSLPGPITLDNIRAEHYSRNRRLMRVLKLLGLVEEYGEGVDRMFAEMEARLMEPPLFAPTPTSVTVTLRNRSLISIADQAWLALLGHRDLSPAERRVLVIARHERAVTPRMLRALAPELDVEAVLSGATAKGMLVRVGARGGTRYVLSDEVIMRAGGEGLEARSRQRQMLLDEIQRRGSLSTNEAMSVLGTGDRPFVTSLLRDLVGAGVVRAEGRTRARRYYSAG